MRTIALGYGKGVDGEKACWMTALQAHLGGKWTDKCDRVSPIINNFRIMINDLYMDDEERSRDILEFGLFDPIGTNEPEKEQDRLAILQHLESILVLDRIIEEHHDNYTFASLYRRIIIYNTKTGHGFNRGAFIRKYLFPTLRAMIGDSIPKEVVPSEEFYQRVGCKVVNV